jgi:hypothetical protein
MRRALIKLDLASARLLAYRVIIWDWPPAGKNCLRSVQSKIDAQRSRIHVKNVYVESALHLSPGRKHKFEVSVGQSESKIKDWK